MPDRELVDRTFLVDETTGRVVTHVDGLCHGLTADGRLILSRTRDHKTAVWDVPPRKPFWLVAGFSVGWGVIVGLVVRWWSQQAAPETPTPLIASLESRE